MLAGPGLFLVLRRSHPVSHVPLQEFTATERELKQQMSREELCHPIPQSFEPVKSFFKGLMEAMQRMFQKPLDVRLKESKSPRDQLCVPSLVSFNPETTEESATVNRVSPTQRPLAVRSKAPGSGPAHSSDVTSYPSQNCVLPLAAMLLRSAPQLPLGFCHTSTLLLWGPRFNGQLPLFFRHLVKAQRPCRASTPVLSWDAFPHHLGLTPSPGHLPLCPSPPISAPSPAWGCL